MIEGSDSQFDRIIPRRGTRSYKWDSRPEEGGDNDLLPMWVADMDFPSAGVILEALRSRIDHGIFGYTQLTGPVYEVYRTWVLKRQHADLPVEWMLYTQGVLAALALTVQALSVPGDGVIIQPPVYYPFERLIRQNGRVVFENPLIESDGRWFMDLEHLEDVAKKGAKILLLCSPHNPVGRVWSLSELGDMLDVCQRHSILVISDEIHSDIVMPGHEHIPLFSLSERKGVDTVVLTSPTKTFNLAGLPMAWMIAPRPETRLALKQALAASHAGSTNVLSVVAAETAYGSCGDWVDELIAYLSANRITLQQELVGAVPGLTIAPLEGTYLSWLDFRQVAVNGKDLKRIMLQKADLWLNDGAMFGTGGAGFQRLNLAAPRSRVLDAADRIRRAFS